MGGMSSGAMNSANIPTRTSGGMVPGALGAAVQGMAKQATQGSNIGGMRAGSGPSPMPTMQDNFSQPYAPTYQPMVASPARQVQQAGLQALMANMMAQYQNVPGSMAMPQQGFMPQQAPMPMPQFRSPALNYRPNIEAVQQNLSRVRPSVYKTDLDNARARIAELEAAEQARQASSDTGYYSGG